MPRNLVLSMGLLAISSLMSLVEADDEKKVAWYGTLDGGLAEAKRSGRPILLLSAAPHCEMVSGIW